MDEIFEIKVAGLAVCLARMPNQQLKFKKEEYERILGCKMTWSYDSTIDEITITLLQKNGR